MGCVVPTFFFITTRWKKKIQRSLSLSTHLSLCFGRTGLEEKPDPERAEIRAGHPTPLRGPTVLGNAPLLSRLFSPVSASLSLYLAPAFPLPLLVSFPLLCPPPCFTPIFTILPSAPAPSSPDTRHSAASQVSPFSSTASLLWWCCSAVVLTAHSFPCFPHSDLCSALGPQRNGSLPCLLTFYFVCVCVSERVCGWVQAVVSYPAKYA